MIPSKNSIKNCTKKVALLAGSDEGKQPLCVMWYLQGHNFKIECFGRKTGLWTACNYKERVPLFKTKAKGRTYLLKIAIGLSHILNITMLSKLCGTEGI